MPSHRSLPPTRAFARSVRVTARLLWRNELHLPERHVGRRLPFTDGTRSLIFRETVRTGVAVRRPTLLVVEFRLRLVGRSRLLHALFRRESVLNTPLFAGFAGFRTKLWITDETTACYRGVYEWDGADRAYLYATTLSSLLRLVCVPGSVRFRIEPGLRPVHFLDGTHPCPAPGRRMRSPRRARAASGSPEVLVVGAGPTGLALAAQLHAHGATVRIVDRRVERQRSRAFVVQPRTLEMLAPLGLTGALLARGDPSARVTVRAGARSASVTLARPGLGDTAYPFLLAMPQAVVEEVLEDHLRRVGVEVERGVALAGLAQRPDGVRCRLRGPDDSTQDVHAGYVAGCDGRDSTVRTLAGVPFRARDYRPTLLMANVDVAGARLAPDTVHGYVAAPGVLFLFRSPEAAGWRLLTVGHRGGDAGAAPDLATLQAAADRFTGGALRLRALGWSSTVRLVRGQAGRYRAGRVLLAGDAAHVNSPAGAQGMNTGIQDASNLGWKLAYAATGVADTHLLDSYQAERWPVARRVRQLTDLAFAAEASQLPPLGWLRARAAPLVLPLLDGATAPAWAFRLLGGLLIRHRRGLAATHRRRWSPARLRAGDRLPDGQVVDDDGTPRWLHDVLRPPGFHVLHCGTDGADPLAGERLARWSPVPLRVHEVSSRPRPGALWDPDGRLLRRLGGDGICLVRPDGYVAWRSRAGLDAVVPVLARLLGGSAVAAVDRALSPAPR